MNKVSHVDLFAIMSLERWCWGNPSLGYDMGDLWGFVSFYGPSQTDTYECGELWILHGMVYLLDCGIHSQERWVYSILAGMKKTIWGNREGSEISLIRVRLLPLSPWMRVDIEGRPFEIRSKKDCMAKKMRDCKGKKMKNHRLRLCLLK